MGRCHALRKKVSVPSSWYKRQKRDKDWFKEKHNTLLIVATLIATVTFAAGLSPPGGFWQDPPNSNSSSSSSSSPSPFSSDQQPRAGTAINDKSGHKNFKKFMYFDMSGLVSSLFIILFLISGLPLKNQATTWILVITMWVAVTSMTMAFVYGTRQIVVSDSISDKLFWVLVSWSGLMGVLLFWHFIVFLAHLIHLFLKIVPLWSWVEMKVAGWRNEKVSDDQRDIEIGQVSSQRKE